MGGSARTGWEISLGDEAYPRSLLELERPPEELRGLGDPGALSGPCLAVVGARRATPYGLAVAEMAAATGSPSSREGPWDATARLASRRSRRAAAPSSCRAAGRTSSTRPRPRTSSRRRSPRAGRCSRSSAGERARGGGRSRRETPS